MNNYCAACGKALEGLPYKCRYCGEYFCVDHQIPENHACQGLDDWKAGKLKKFKKDVGPPKKVVNFSDIIKNNKWLEFLLVIVVVIILILVLRVLT